MKNLFLLIILCCSFQVFAQQDINQWRVGVLGGAMTYYGDLSNSYFDVQPAWTDPVANYEDFSFGLSLEKSISPAWSWRLAGTRGQFQANDRKVDWTGNLLNNAPNYDRSLNVETQITNVLFSFNYQLDNGWLLGKRSFVAPYLNIGVGWTWFTPFGDLFGNNDSRYFYWSDNTIRTSPENPAPTFNPSIINQDGIFETDLSAIQTEGIDYQQSTLSFPIGLGLKFRLSDYFNLNIEAQGIYTMTDYLDDVSGQVPATFDNNLQRYASEPGNLYNSAWRGTPDDALNDIYGFVSVGLYYNFGKRKDYFLPPSFYTIDTKGVDKEIDKATKKEETIVETEDISSNNTSVTKNTVIKEEEIVIKEDTIIVKEEKSGLVTVPDEDNLPKKDTVIVIKEEKTTVIADNQVTKKDTVVIIKEENTSLSTVPDEDPVIQKDTIVEIEKIATSDPIINPTIDSQAVDIDVAESIIKVDTSVKIVQIDSTSTTQQEVVEVLPNILKEDTVAIETSSILLKNDTIETLPNILKEENVEVASNKTNEQNDEIEVVSLSKKDQETIVVEEVLASSEVSIIDTVSLQNEIVDQSEDSIQVDKSIVSAVPIADSLTKISIRVDTVYMPVKEEVSAEMLAKVEESRLELAQLQEKYNTAILENEVNENKATILQTQLDSMQAAFEAYQTFNQEVDPRTNIDTTKQAVQAATKEMAKEIDYLKFQLKLSQTNYKIAYENAEQNQRESQEKINNLEKKVGQLKKDLKESKAEKREKRPKRNLPVIVNESRLEPKEKVTTTDAIADQQVEMLDTTQQAVAEKVDTLINEAATVANENVVQKKNIVTISKTDTIIEQPIEEPKAEVITEEKTTPTVISEKVVKDTIVLSNQNAIDSISKALTIQKEAELAQKEAEIKALNDRLAALETSLEVTKKVDNDAVSQLQNKLDTLFAQLEASKRTNENKVVAPVVERTTVSDAIKGYEVSNVYFGVGKSRIDPDFENRLEKIAALMLIYPELNAVITGYTDKSGNPAINFKLSQQRANAVKSFLAQRGVQPNRLETNYYGENKASASNDPYSRRVEILLVK